MRREELTMRGAMDFGEVVRRARQAKDVTQMNLAEELDTTQRAISEIENGKTTIFLCRLFDIFDCLGVDITASWVDSDFIQRKKDLTFAEASEIAYSMFLNSQKPNW